MQLDAEFITNQYISISYLIDKKVYDGDPAVKQLVEEFESKLKYVAKNNVKLDEYEIYAKYDIPKEPAKLPVTKPSQEKMENEEAADQI